MLVIYSTVSDLRVTKVRIVYSDFIAWHVVTFLYVLTTCLYGMQNKKTDGVAIGFQYILCFLLIIFQKRTGR
jgi:hypothetical protein